VLVSSSPSPPLREYGDTVTQALIGGNYADSRTLTAVRAFLDRHHVRYVYLPPYSPELNPSEEAWSKVKHVLKREKPRTVDHLLGILHRAAQSITPNDAQGYFQHAEDFSLVTV